MRRNYLRDYGGPDVVWPGACCLCMPATVNLAVCTSVTQIPAHLSAARLVGQQQGEHTSNSTCVSLQEMTQSQTVLLCIPFLNQSALKTGPPSGAGEKCAVAACHSVLMLPCLQERMSAARPHEAPPWILACQCAFRLITIMCYKHSQSIFCISSLFHAWAYGNAHQQQQQQWRSIAAVAQLRSTCHSVSNESLP
jgi:hypothetical protein